MVISSKLSVKKETGVDDGTRTHDDWNHNPGLYQLSYAHHESELTILTLDTCGFTSICHRSLKLARLTGLEPVTYGLAYHYSFHCPGISIEISRITGSWSGLYLRHLRRGTYSLYGSHRSDSRRFPRYCHRHNALRFHRYSTLHFTGSFSCKGSC